MSRRDQVERGRGTACRLSRRTLRVVTCALFVIEPNRVPGSGAAKRLHPGLKALRTCALRLAPGSRATGAGTLIGACQPIKPSTQPLPPRHLQRHGLTSEQTGVAAFSNTGRTGILDGISYYAPPDPVASIGFQPLLQRWAGQLVPVTVVNSPNLVLTSGAYTNITNIFKASDDVWQDGFSKIVYAQYNGTTPANARNPFKCDLKNAVAIAAPNFGQPVLPNGPYLVDVASGSVFKAYRLYSDFAGAFTETVIQAADGSFSVLPAGTPGQHLAVAVPSRLYYTKSATKPISGVRIGIKDIYDIAGLRTSNGNRAWYKFYPPASTTAVAVQRLIDAGAVVVGKMVTSQFANGETATADWVDYHEPFNPRGDGYQDTSSSSSGPGAGEASYDWLDITLGSDTGGSIRGPSEVQGLFGNRPSFGLVPLTGVMPLAPELDTSGFLCRDPSIWSACAQVLYSTNISKPKTYSSYPKKIVTVGFPTNASTPSNGILLDFLSSLQKFLSAAPPTALDLTAAFAANPPQNAPPNVALTSILNITYPILIAQEQTRLVRDPFYAAYGAAHQGRRPFIDPTPLVRWGFGDSFPTSFTADAVRNKTMFKDWFEANVLVPDYKSKTCSDKVLLYVGSTSDSQVYRNVYRSSPGVPYGFSSGRISVFTGAPDFVVPLGEAGYSSSITLHQEVLPVTVDIMVARGCDGMLFDLINALANAGIVMTSKAGGSVDAGGDVLARRASTMHASGSLRQ